jgi:hypothetical protein
VQARVRNLIKLLKLHMSESKGRRVIMKDKQRKDQGAGKVLGWGVVGV